MAYMKVNPGTAVPPTPVINYPLVKRVRTQDMGTNQTMTHMDIDTTNVSMITVNLVSGSVAQVNVYDIDNAVALHTGAVTFPFSQPISGTNNVRYTFWSTANDWSVDLTTA